MLCFGTSLKVDKNLEKTQEAPTVLLQSKTLEQTINSVIIGDGIMLKIHLRKRNFGSEIGTANFSTFIAWNFFLALRILGFRPRPDFIRRNFRPLKPGI